MVSLQSYGSVLRRRLIFVILVITIFAVWYLFFSYTVCWDKVCFNENLKQCNRARFIGGDDMIFEYFIKGEKDGKCEVKVELLQGEVNSLDSMKLKGQTMICLLPLEVIMAPEGDIRACHGLLKEGLQDIVIRKLHSYLVKNIGRLNLEMSELPKI